LNAAQASTVSETDAARPAARPVALERFRPYFDLHPPQGLEPADTPAVTIHTPLMAWEAVRTGREPWFEAIHPQRAAPSLFRRELSNACTYLECPTPAASAVYEQWRQAPDGCPPEAGSLLDAFAETDTLGQALLGRLLIALGFQVHAKSLLPGPEHAVRTPEQAYAFSTWLFAEQAITTGYDVQLDPHFQSLHEQLGQDARYGRIRVVNCINAMVCAARRRDADTVARWRVRGERALATYTALPEVEEFEAELMTSRYYRAAGFLPFLTKDADLLESDLDRWLGIARELTGHDERTRILAADNLFPAIETAVRSRSALGDEAGARALMDELSTVVDPLDSKVQLEAGELHFHAGDVTAALAAYRRAADLAVPHARYAWFNAGQCEEQLGRPRAAVECYRNSLANWPSGITPLRRLRDLADDPELAADRDSLLAWAAQQPAWERISTPSAI
jgi:tetratricopeptide (TPR) repeat protein